MPQAYRNYQRDRPNWLQVFDRLKHGASFREISDITNIPVSTLHRHYQAFCDGDPSATESQHKRSKRIFSDEQENSIIESLQSKKKHFNKPDVRAETLYEWEKLHESDSVASNTRSHHQKSFSASNRFIYNLRHRTSQTSRHPRPRRRRKQLERSETADKLEAQAVEFVYNVRTAFNIFEPRLIINCDEISAKGVVVSQTVWCGKNSPRPEIESSFSERDCWSMMFAITANGQKLKPALYVKAKRQSVASFDEIAHRCVIISAPSGHSNTSVHVEWINQVLLPYVDGEPAMLVYDSAPSHLSKRVEESLEENGIAAAIVPNHATPTLQPLDVGLFAPMRSLVGKYFLHDHSSHIRFDEKAVKCIKRYLDAFDALSADAVRASWVQALLPAESQPKSHKTNVIVNRLKLDD